MTKQTLTVSTPVGTFSRTTARTYTHIVFCRAYRHDKIDAEGTASRTHYTSELAKKRKALSNLPALRAEWLHLREMDDATLTATWQGYIDGMQAELDALEGRTANRHEESDAAFNRMNPAGTACGEWAGRLDLARKNAAKSAQTYREVRIFDIATGEEVR